MTTNKQLRELARKATVGPWWIDSHGHRMSANGGLDTVFIADDRMGPAARHPETGNLSHWPNDWDASFIATANPATVLALLDEIEALQGRCGKLVSALRRISYRASGYECRQAPTSDLQRAFSDLMKQADDALYCFYNEGIPRQRNCEYAGCSEPAVDEALCAVHLEDWREQQASDAVTQKGKP